MLIDLILLIVGLFVPGPRAHVLDRARTEYPRRPRFYARRPGDERDDERLVLVATPGGLVLFGEDDVTVVPWSRVGRIIARGDDIEATVATESGGEARVFVFLEARPPRYLTWASQSSSSFARMAERARVGDPVRIRE